MTGEPGDGAARALWIGGGQWAGKSTVADILARRHGLAVYHQDLAHADGPVRSRLTRPADPEAAWVAAAPTRMVAAALAAFADEIDLTVADLRALASPRPVLAEGWGMRPDLVVPRVATPDRMVVLVPTPAFRASQARRLDARSAAGGDARPDARPDGDAAGRAGVVLSDPARARRNLMTRDQLLAADAAARARRLGVRVIEVDGSLDAEGVADVVADHFAPHLR